MPATARAGAWVPEAGSAYHKLAVTYFESNDFFGSRPGFEEFTDVNISYYGEYGLGGNTAFFLSVPFANLEQIQDGNTTDSAGLADVDFGLRVNFVDGPFVLSGSALLKAPWFYDGGDALPRGNGQEDLELRLLFGKSLGRLGYFGVETGYRFRLEDPSDEFRYLIEYGFSATENLYFRAKLDGIESIGNGRIRRGFDGNPALSPEFDLGRLELTSGWSFSKSKGEDHRFGPRVHLCA